MATETITLRLVAQDLMSGNVSKAIGGLDKLAQRGGLVGSVMQGVGQSMGQLLNPVALVANGIGAVTDALGDSLNAYREDQQSQTQLRAALEANIEAWDGNTDAIEGTIAARMKLGFSDDEQRASLALLVSQVEDVSDALAIQRTAMDLARLKGMGLAEASTVLAKAYLGSSTALQKMGIKLAKGVDGMEALAAVQQRTAGQAEAWADTSAGAAETFSLKVGELQEKVGGLLDGPARGFIDFLSGVVDVIDGPDGASANIRDLTGTIVNLRTQTDAINRGNPFETLATDLAGWNQELSQAESVYRNSTWFEWMSKLGPDTLRNFGKASAETFADVRGLAQGVIDAGGSFGEFAMIVRQKVAPSFNVLTSAWTGTADAVGVATNEIVHHAGRIRAVPFQMLRSLTDVKAEWKAGWRNLAEWAKDPFRPEAFEKWINKQTEKALAEAKDKDNAPAVRRNWRKIANAMKSPILASLVDIGMGVDEAIAKIIEIQALGKRVDPLAIVVTGANGGSGRAKGGPVEAGRTYTVGEEGEETLVMGRNGGGYVLPNGRTSKRSSRSSSGGASVNVNVTIIGSMSEADGQRFARTVTPHIRRELARSGG